jgi:hypothetical protein
MYYKILPSKRSKLSTISDIELFDYLDKFNKNLIRWGDGETNIALGFPNIFQESNQQLKQTLNEIVMNYSEKSPYILALPTKFIDSKNSNLTLKEKNTWSKTRHYFSKNKIKYLVADAFVFRNFLTHRDGVSNIIIKQWLAKYNSLILVSSNNESENFIRNFIGDFNIKHILIKPKNAFEDLDKIYSDIKEKYLKLENCAILISAGPTAKVIVYKLSNECIPAFDVGYLLDPEPILKKYNISERVQQK